MISAFRFFTVAPIHSRYMMLALGAVLVSGITALIIDPAKGGDVLGPLILIQMFAASTGFAVAARRGHLDLLLTAGPRRVTIAVTHFVLSILPGLVVWYVLGLVEMLMTRTLHPRAFASGSVVALGVTSGLAWALTVRLPRLSGGIAWLLGIAVWVVGWSGASTVTEVAMNETAHPVMRAVVVAICPFALLGTRLSIRGAVVALPSVVLAVAVVVWAVMWIARMDVPLESAQ